MEAKSDREAGKLLAKFVAEVEKGEYIEPSKQTFAGFVEKWLKEYGESNLAPKTLDRYRRMLKSRIIPALGHIKHPNGSYRFPRLFFLCLRNIKPTNRKNS